MVSAVAARPATATSFSAVEDARAQALEKRRETRLADAKEAIETLKAARISSRDVQKEMARRKLEEIKERIRMLKMTASMDPAGTARQIAALARELAGALKAYGAATAQGSLQVSTQVSPGGQAPGPVVDNGAHTDEGPGLVAGMAMSVQARSANSTEPGDTRAVRIDPDTRQPAKDPAAVRASELYRQIQVSPEQGERERNLQARRAEAADAEDFMRQVRDLAKTLKDILQKIEQAARAKGSSGRDDVEDAEKSLGQLAQQIGFATASMPATVAVAA